MVNYTVRIIDKLLRFDTTNDSVTATLLPFAQTPNAQYEFQKISTADTNTVTIQVDPTTADFLLPDGSTTITLDNTNYLVTIKIPGDGSSPAYVSGLGGGTGGGGVPGGPAPPVWIDPVADVIFRNNQKIEVDVTWTEAASATSSNFTGAAVYLEDPDISSGAYPPLDTVANGGPGVPLDGSAQVSGKWAPARETDSYAISGTKGGVAVVFPDGATTYTQTRNVRIYLAAFGPGSPPNLVRAVQPDGTADPNATPNIMVEIPIGPGQGQSGMEWAFLVTNPNVTVTTDYNRPDPNYYLTFTYTPPDPSAPVPPGIHNFGAARIVYVYFDAQGNEIFPGTDAGIDVPAAQSATGYKSPVYTASAGGGQFRVYFCSEDDSQPFGMHVNSLVDGVTPYFDVTVPPVSGGSTGAPDVTNFQIGNERTVWNPDGSYDAAADFSWSLPAADAGGARYAGVKLYLVSAAPDTSGCPNPPCNDGSVPLTTFPTALSSQQSNTDTKFTLAEMPPSQPEVWTIAAISVSTSGTLADDPSQYGKPSFHSPTVEWSIGPPLPGSAGSGQEYAPFVTVGGSAAATATQTLSADGVGMVSFQVGPWVNPASNQFGGVQVAMVVNNQGPQSAVYWQVPNGATSFTTPPMTSFGNFSSSVPVDFYLVSDDPQGHKNSLVIGADGTPKIGSTFLPDEGQIIPARSGWFDPGQFQWDTSGKFQAQAFSASVIQVGKTLVVGGAPASFGGSDNGQIAVLDASGKLLDWFGEQQPKQGSGNPLWGAWLGQVWIGGTSPLDAPVFVDNQGIIEVGGIAARQGSQYPYVSIRDEYGYEKGRIGAQISVPSGSIYDAVGSNAPQLSAGAWFTQFAAGGPNLANWNLLITPDPNNPVGSEFLMRNIGLLSIDYPAQYSTTPANYEYKLEFGSSVWTALQGTPASPGQYQFPGIHIYEVDGNQNLFGAVYLNRGMVLKGTLTQGYPVLASLVTYNGQPNGAETLDEYFWGELAMYSPNYPNARTVYLASGNQFAGSALFVLSDVKGNQLFNVDQTGNVYISAVLQGNLTPGGAQTAVDAFAYAINGYGTVIDSKGNWKGRPIAGGAAGAQTPWSQDIAGAGFNLLNAGEVHASAYYLGGGTPGAGTALVNTAGTFVGVGVDVGTNPVYCGFLSTVQNPGGSGEIDCGLIKSNSNIVASNLIDPNSLPGTGWVVAEHLGARLEIGCATLTVGTGGIYCPNGSTQVINSAGTFVGNGIASTGQVTCPSLVVHGQINAEGDIIGNRFLQNTVGLVINENGQFVGQGVDVQMQGIGCGYLTTREGRIDCGSITCTVGPYGNATSTGLITCSQFTASANAGSGDAIAAGLVGAAMSQFRAVWGNYGVMFRNDGGNFYILTTNSGDPYGYWNNLRPLTIDFAGNVTLAFDASGATRPGTHVPTDLVVSGIATIGGTPGWGGNGINCAGQINAGGDIVCGNSHNFVAPNTSGFYGLDTGGGLHPMLRTWNDNSVYLDSEVGHIYIRPGSSWVMPGANGSANFGNPAARWATIYCINLDVSNPPWAAAGSGVTAISMYGQGQYQGVVTLYPGTGISFSGTTIRCNQDISPGASPSFGNLTVTSNLQVNNYLAVGINGPAHIDSGGNIGCQQINSTTIYNSGTIYSGGNAATAFANWNSSAAIYNTGNIGCQTLQCTGITVNGVTATGPSGCVWVQTVQTTQYVLAGQFGIYGQVWGWPGGAGSIGTFRTGDNRTVYVMGGIIYNVA